MGRGPKPHRARVRRGPHKAAGTLFRLIVLVAIVVGLSSPGLWQTLNPLPYRPLLVAAADRASLSPYLVAAVVRVESKGDPRAISRRGAVGLMQLMPDTARWAAVRMGKPSPTHRDLVSPQFSLDVGSWYLAYLLKQYGNDPVLALAAYNAGQGTVGHWLATGAWDGSLAQVNRVPYPETREFVRLVISGYRAYQTLYSPHAWRP